jgi:dipeptidyl aminopeptidase/acylaminoacyl peptidase
MNKLKIILTTRCLILFVQAISFFGSIAIYAQADNGDQKVIIHEWLKVGSFRVKMPVFDSVTNVKGEKFTIKDLLTSPYLDLNNLCPVENGRFLWNSEKYGWEKVNAAKDDYVFAERKLDIENNELAFFASWLQADRWMKATIDVSSAQLFEVYLDGKLLTSKTSADDKDADKIGSSSKECELERGKHLLIVKSLKPVTSPGDWKVKAEIAYDKTKFGNGSLTTDLSPKQMMTIGRLLNGINVTSISVSPNGTWVLINYSKVVPPDGNSESWTEVRDLMSGRLFQSFRNSEVSGINWSPVASKLTYQTYEKEKTTLWVFDLEKMEEQHILENVENFGGYEWSPNGNFIIYTVIEKPEENKTGLDRLEGMPDRWPWWRSRGFLYKLDIRSGVSERLTYGHLATNLEDIRNDGTKILFSQNIPDYTERPYSRQILMEMDMEAYKVDTLWIKIFGGSCQYSPDGKSLLVTGSPAMFGKTGVSVKGDLIPNDYDIQAYIYHISDGGVDPISLRFNPSIQQAKWSDFDQQKIYLLAEDRTYCTIYSYDLVTRQFIEIESGFDVVNGFSMAKMNPLAVCIGSSISTPPYANQVNLETGEIRTITDPTKKDYENVVFGKSEDWNFYNDSNVEIEGRIYYPPDFDINKKYPLIVNYYAGTSPINRGFGGRYPLNVYAAEGYVVYVLQPSGATGYGQTFSAMHVNNWGITVADEIIKGTRLFIETHPFINPEKVGCIGASYGGFMTMLLQTRTDIFAAAVAHAGISSISSYWGEGYWGYLYNAVAAANSFPWNNSRVYIDESPIFNADKIKTPLLLLHGTDDTNVPTGESVQLYTALKLLGKPVELIEVEGQDHHILDYKKRIRWQNTIFAWFDKYLKDQPAWWDNLYPEENL